MRSFEIKKNDAGQRLDKYISKSLPLLPQALMYKYIRTKRISHPFLVGTISVLALAFVVQGVLDLVYSAVGYGDIGDSVIIYEFAIGVAFGLCATVLHTAFKEYSPKQEKGTESDAVQ